MEDSNICLIFFIAFSLVGGLVRLSFCLFGLCASFIKRCWSGVCENAFLPFKMCSCLVSRYVLLGFVGLDSQIC